MREMPIKMSSRRFVPMTAAILLSANSVFAAELVNDAQLQASGLLTATLGGHAKIVYASPPIPAHDYGTSYLDPQEQARAPILGKPNFGRVTGAALYSESKASAGLPTRGKRGAYSDAQELARRMILGMGA